MSPKINISLTVLYAICACLSLFLSYETYITDRGILPILFGVLFGVITSAVIYLIASTPDEPPVLDDNVAVVTTIYPWGHAVEADHPINDKSWDNIISLIHANLNVGVKVTLDFIPPSK